MCGKSDEVADWIGRTLGFGGNARSRDDEGCAGQDSNLPDGDPYYIVSKH